MPIGFLSGTTARIASLGRKSYAPLQGAGVAGAFALQGCIPAIRVDQALRQSLHSSGLRLL
jgi:hypothetical protein